MEQEYQRRVEASKRGILSWMLEEDQVQIYEFFLNCGESRSRLGHISRRVGKTFVGFLIISEVGLGNKAVCARLNLKERDKRTGQWKLKWNNLQLGFLGETKEQIEGVLYPMMDIIWRYLPQNLRPVFKERAKGYVFPQTKSVLKIAGTDNKGYERLRGSETHLCVLDEAAFHSDLAYIIKSILMPQTMRAKGKIFLMSTSPRNADHYFVDEIGHHIRNANYLKLTIDEKTSMDEKTKQELIDDMGGRESVDVRRELLCEIVSDEDSKIFPEATDAHMQEVVVSEYTLPHRYDSYSALDPGANDYCGFLTAYYDFQRAKIVIVDEIFEQHKRTDELAEKVRILEGTHFGPKEPSRVCDSHDKILINDLSRMHGLTFAPTRKDTLDAMVNQARVLLKTNRIEIMDNCKNLIFQLKVGVWNASRVRFARSESQGHYDMLAAFIYLCRKVNMSKNPYEGIDSSFLTGDYVLPENVGVRSDSDEIKKAFSIS